MLKATKVMTCGTCLHEIWFVKSCKYCRWLFPSSRWCLKKMATSQRRSVSNISKIRQTTENYATACIWQVFENFKMRLHTMFIFFRLFGNWLRDVYHVSCFSSAVEKIWWGAFEVRLSNLAIVSLTTVIRALLHVYRQDHPCQDTKVI